jgi:hypothetical protein
MLGPTAMKPGPAAHRFCTRSPSERKASTWSIPFSEYQISEASADLPAAAYRAGPPATEETLVSPSALRKEVDSLGARDHPTASGEYQTMPMSRIDGQSNPPIRAG